MIKFSYSNFISRQFYLCNREMNITAKKREGQHWMSWWIFTYKINIDIQLINQKSSISVFCTHIRFDDTVDYTLSTTMKWNTIIITSSPTTLSIGESIRSRVRYVNRIFINRTERTCWVGNLMTSETIKNTKYKYITFF